ncbi:hypothetical protein QF037_000300 [Streptomyces canus]|uniref:hypothetical protein n=1 Tax=Streptomyces canus TaxID=58343 RepID=UPI00278475FA|nr:hypothetical protein [Streptomyces canus]MDQ0595955.1 hypothetical protein [Streptomyces canus]
MRGEEVRHRPEALTSPWQTYIRSTDYDPYGLLTGRSYGSPSNSDTNRGVTAHRDYSYYYAGGTRWLSGITTTVNAGLVTTERQQDLYTHDRDGKILKIWEQASGQTAHSQCFRYDDQARLITS